MEVGTLFPGRLTLHFNKFAKTSTKSGKFWSVSRYESNAQIYRLELGGCNMTFREAWESIRRGQPAD